MAKWNQARASVCYATIYLTTNPPKAMCLSAWSEGNSEGLEAALGTGLQLRRPPRVPCNAPSMLYLPGESTEDSYLSETRHP